MFYAERLYWTYVIGTEKFEGNYTLDFDKSLCTRNTSTTPGANTTSAMYGFSFIDNIEILSLFLVFNYLGRMVQLIQFK